MNLIGLDGQRIIIFGGAADVANYPFTPEESLYVLNLNNFEWSIPKTSGQTPNSQIFHKENVIRKYMAVSFGKCNILMSVYFKLSKQKF